ncbi:hypothetical protein [Ralstonia mojiangensis]|uniref:hypothetical protein n=1 Tax=Ralstonia mojiangensis TaxID=2953895 RepID=UPI002091D848|nr:hypothetical protein [Ralstonia mojiangensis]MCO5413452.1 hypothetical protein [Ralstonia mojiangensis]
MGKMKKFILAVATGVCAISAHAEDPKPIDFNVQLKGEVPAQEFFEVTPIEWKSGDQVDLAIPEDWDLKKRLKTAKLEWNVRSSHGAVRLTLNTEKRDGYYGLMPDVSDASGEPLRFYPHYGSGWIGGQGSDMGQAVTVTSADKAASGAVAHVHIIVEGPSKGKAIPGHAYGATATAIFETGFES